MRVNIIMSKPTVQDAISTVIQDLGGSVVEKVNASVDCCISSQGIYNHVIRCTTHYQL